MQTTTYRLHFISAILAGAFSLCGCGGPSECVPCDTATGGAALMAQCDENGCPDDGGSYTTPSADVSPAFNGTWVGSADYHSGRMDYAYTAVFSSSVSGGQLVVRKFGIDGDGYVVASGSGSSVSWSGSTVLTISNGACPTGSVEYTSGTFSVSSGIYTMTLYGTEHWCGMDSPASMTIHRATIYSTTPLGIALDY